MHTNEYQRTYLRLTTKQRKPNNLRPYGILPGMGVRWLEKIELLLYQGIIQWEATLPHCWPFQRTHLFSWRTNIFHIQQIEGIREESGTMRNTAIARKRLTAQSAHPSPKRPQTKGPKRKKREIRWGGDYSKCWSEWRNESSASANPPSAPSSPLSRPLWPLNKDASWVHVWKG